MAIKNWTDGDFLYGADLDDIVTSIVMRFPDVATRNAVLVGDLAPKPGMMAYTDDSKQTRQYVVVASVGYWAPLPGTVVAELYQSSPQSIPSATYTALAMHVYRLDRGGGAFGSVSRYTPNVPGYYTVMGSVSLPVFNGVGTVGVGKNGVLQVGGYSTLGGTTNGNTCIPSYPVTLYANGTGDYFEAYGRQSTAGALTTVVSGFACNLSVTYAGQ